MVVQTPGEDIAVDIDGDRVLPGGRDGGEIAVVDDEIERGGALGIRHP